MYGKTKNKQKPKMFQIVDLTGIEMHCNLHISFLGLCEQNLMTEIQINKVSLLKPLTGMQDIHDKPLYSDLFET